MAIADKDDLPLVCLVVLNWNGYADTDECLVSLAQTNYPNYRIMVLDNGSTDDSPHQIARHHPEAELIRCEKNKGIAAGYNAGIQAALARGAEYVVVMNNDLIFAPDFLTEMVTVAEEWPDCGVVMPKIYYYNDPDVIWSVGGRPRWFASNILLRGRQQQDGARWQKTEVIELAPSCCLLITRDVATQVEFDEDYFFYFDDWDFSMQVRRTGWQIIFAPEAHVWHKVSRSTQNSPRSLEWWKVLGQSCVRFHRKHHSFPMLAMHVSWVIIRETMKGNVRSLPMFIKGVLLGLKASL
jgi:GT2 family glycosyltransferase